MKLNKKYAKIQLLVILGAVFIGLFTYTVVDAVSTEPAAQQEQQEVLVTQQDDNTTYVNPPTNEEDILKAEAEIKAIIAFSAALAVGLCGLGASFGMGSAASAAIGAITERPEVFGKAIIFVAFIEAIAIYGLVVAVLLWLQL